MRAEKMIYRKTTINAHAPGQLTQGAARAARWYRDRQRSDCDIATRSGDNEPWTLRHGGPNPAPLTAIQARKRYAATVEVAPPRAPGGGEGAWTSGVAHNYTVTSEIRNHKNAFCSTRPLTNAPTMRIIAHHEARPSILLGIACFVTSPLGRAFYHREAYMPPRYAVEWWDSDEMYHWANSATYSEPYCCRWTAYREAWAHFNNNDQGQTRREKGHE